MNSYTLDISREELIDSCLKELIIKWCEDNHPNIIKEIRQKLEAIYEEQHENQLV